ncbi:DNA gyrase inhibitor YacG [Fertoebacter nigrum]|uniref:DNA gyrase inhibitor YacG n=1 Tax=Fertoeibacter niger TaxID=2656921 RepID=A0A8X8KQL0_9RHOB|nr:DNA gyrase inhibitor YacG [Fertoeibacter niger]
MTCPICAKDADPKYRPFCSRRCADVDLGRWLTGSYAIPAEPVDPDACDEDTDLRDRPSHH